MVRKVVMNTTTAAMTIYNFCLTWLIFLE